MDSRAYVGGEAIEAESVRVFFERIYTTYARPSYIHPDPLEIVLEYEDPADREIAGLIAASLAVGRVKSILGCVREVCRRLGSPRARCIESTDAELEALSSGFVYRFYRAEHLTGLLVGIKRLLLQHGSLQRAFVAHRSASDDTCFPALIGFVDELYACAPHVPKMVSVPSKGSGCKRLLLFLRWMVRRDAVDPGGWDLVSPASLLVPVDVHIHNIALRLGITRRSTTGLRTTMEVTDFFRILSPSDPARYDFPLSRFGIHPDLSYDNLRVDGITKLIEHMRLQPGPIREDDCR